MITDAKSKIFLRVFSLLVVVSIAVTYYNYVILKNYDFFTDEETFRQALFEE